ncbi:MAG: alpha/beta hydrolase [Deltaproteobacteria bacterium]|nr:alpha/beta hydrolase [Deltaproteobacteria bacterium]
MHSIFDSDDFNDRLFFPRRSVSAVPAGAVDRMIDVPGETLHLRWHRAEGSTATLLLFHGNGEVVADYDDAAGSFAAIRLDLCVVDYRGYGQSSGSPTLRNTITDASLVLAAVVGESPLPVIIMGRSLGSACAAELYGAPQDPNVLALIFESGFVSLHGLLDRRGMAAHRPTPEELAVFDPIPKLARGTLPLLVLHGENDTLIAPAEGDAAHRAAGGADKQLVLVPRRGHNDVSLSDVYWKSMGAFVSRLITRR